MPTTRLSRSIPYWVLVGGSVVTLAGGAYLLISKLSHMATTLTDGTAINSLIALLMGLFLLGTIVPSIALTIRRLHDTNTQGTMFLLSLIPYLGSFIVMIMCLMPEKPEGARFDKINGAG